MSTCPHGDPFCPCQDGDICHYEGPDPMPCPNHPARVTIGDRDVTDALADRPIVREMRRAPHCHVEGCPWPGEDTANGLRNCGLLRVAPDSTLDASYEVGCGLVRRIVEMPRHDPRYADG